MPGCAMKPAYEFDLNYGCEDGESPFPYRTPVPFDPASIKELRMLVTLMLGFDNIAHMIHRK